MLMLRYVRVFAMLGNCIDSVEYSGQHAVSSALSVQPDRKTGQSNGYARVPSHDVMGPAADAGQRQTSAKTYIIIIIIIIITVVVVVSIRS